MSNGPVVSIVMPTLNQGQFIRRSIESVLQQHYKRFELIVVDGGSHDNTHDVLRKYHTRLSHCIIEPDQGQSDAFNKGLKLATGKLVCWLNSDDLLFPNALSKVVDCHSKTGATWIVGGSVWIDAADRALQYRRARRFLRGAVIRGLQGVYGPGAFVDRMLLNAVGGLDLRFHYLMDTVLWMKLAERGCRYRTVDGYLWGMRLHPEAKMSGPSFVGGPLADAEHPSHFRRASEVERLRRHGDGLARGLWKAGRLARDLVSARYYAGLLDTWRYEGICLHDAWNAGRG